MAFKGMNPDEGREIATGVTDAGAQILDLVDSLTSLVNSVEWVGPDYDAYQQDWNAFVSGPVNNLVEGFQVKADELNQHAEQQTEASAPQ